MSKKNALYDAVIKVFDFERDALRYMKENDSEGWTPCESLPPVLSDEVSAWKNLKGNVIAKTNGENFLALYDNLEGFIRLHEWQNKHYGMNAYEGFDRHFLENIDALINTLLSHIGVQGPARYTKDELQAVAEKCLTGSFDVNKHLAAATAYCGQYIVNNDSSYAWGTEHKGSGRTEEYVPYVFSPGNEKFYIAYELLRSIDKRYSREFLWGGVPITFMH